MQLFKSCSKHYELGFIGAPVSKKAFQVIRPKFKTKFDPAEFELHILKVEFWERMKRSFV